MADRDNQETRDPSKKVAAKAKALGAGAFDAVGVIARLREISGSKSDRALCKVIGLSTSTLASYIHRNSIPLPMLLGFAARFEVSLDWLVDGGDFAPATFQLRDDGDYTAATFHTLANSIDQMSRACAGQALALGNVSRMQSAMDRVIELLTERVRRAPPLPVQPSPPETTWAELVASRPKMLRVPKLLTASSEIEHAAYSILASEREKFPPSTLDNLRRWLGGEPVDFTFGEACDAQEGGDE